MTTVALKASLALWKRRYALRIKLRDKARHDLLNAREEDLHPRKGLVDRKIRREQQAEEARKAIVALEKQIADARKPKVAPPLNVILADSWGWHPGVHDGIDLICPSNEPLYAICKAEVVRADAAGWWGKGAPADPVLKAKGDGIIVIRSLVDAGPIFKGMNLCYGHAEGAVVKAGQIVEAGDHIGHAGFAVAWHCHFMVNMRKDALGLGDRDPRPVVDYSRGKK